MASIDLWKTVFIDAGARYGLHPTMAEYLAPREIHAFEPDPDESGYLAQKYADDESYAISGIGLSDEAGEAELNILGHRGLSTTQIPNAGSLWLKDIRPDEGKVRERVTIGTTTLDAYFAGKLITPDFIKLDIEGHELPALRGAQSVLDGILALNVELVFSDTYGRVPAPDILEFLLNEHPFMLVNFDYDGRGYPLSSMQSADRCGVVIGCEAFFIRKPDSVTTGDGTVDLTRFVKLAAFSFRNRAGDLGCWIVEREIACKGRHAGFSDALRKDVPLARYLELLFLRHAHKVKNVSPDGFASVRRLFESVFATEYPDRDRYFRRIDELTALLTR